MDKELQTLHHLHDRNLRMTEQYRLIDIQDCEPLVGEEAVVRVKEKAKPKLVDNG
jgi:hypothetical protein